MNVYVIICLNCAVSTKHYVLRITYYTTIPIVSFVILIIILSLYRESY